MLNINNEKEVHEQASPIKQFGAAFIFLFFSVFFLNEMVKNDVFDLTKFHKSWKSVAFEIFMFIVCTIGAFSKFKHGICLFGNRNKKSL
jgi:hypothetical protein